jgi:Zn-dependent M32 family carboxypeptidase
MPNAVIKSFAKKSGKTENEVEKLWGNLKSEYGEDYARIVGTLKKILKINENFRNWLQENTNFIKSLKDKYKEYFSTINIYEFDNKISIDLIITKEKNTGAGTKLMTDICEYADKNNKIIILSPSDEFGGNKKRLIEFYKRFGFVENKGKNKEFEIFESMYRLPKSK